MEYRNLGRSGLKVPVLSFGTGTFGGQGAFFEKWGSSDVAEASKLVDICMDAGVNFFDTANIYSRGASEAVLGGALKGRRDKALISTKATFTMGDGPNDKGSSRWHLLREVEASLEAAALALIDMGARTVLVSAGADGMLAFDHAAPGGYWSARLPEALSGNPTGAGDAGVAAAAVALAEGITEPREILRRATAWSAAAVLMPTNILREVSIFVSPCAISRRFFSFSARPFTPAGKVSLLQRRVNVRPPRQSGATILLRRNIFCG